MKKMRKFLCGLLAVCMLCSLLPVQAFATGEDTVDAPAKETVDQIVSDTMKLLEQAEQAVSQEVQMASATGGTFGENLTWELVDGVLTISGTGDMANITAPWQGSDFHTVVITDGVTSIGEEAFSGCKTLTSVQIPDSVTSIGSGAFSNCSALKSIDLPAGVTSIGSDAFRGCKKLTSVQLPNGVTSIGDEAFGECKALKSIDIPESVTSIGHVAFVDCSSLTSIVIPDGITMIGTAMFMNCNSLSSIYIPDSVTIIASEAFKGCGKLTQIDLPNNLLRIDPNAFERSGLTSVIIPDSVTQIGSEAFSLCSGLTSVTLSNSITSIGYGMFYRCLRLSSIDIPNGVVSIEGRAFSDCSALTSITIPNSVTSIEDAFVRCSGLESIYFKGNAPLFVKDSFYVVTADAYYPANDATWTEEILQNYGGTITWKSYDPANEEIPDTKNTVSADAEIKEVTRVQMLQIEPALADKSLWDVLVEYVKDPELTITTVLGEEVVPDGGYLIAKDDALRQDMVLKKPDYRDYIIPARVSASFRSGILGNFVAALKDENLVYKHTAFMQEDRADGKPYISTVFGRVSGQNAAYQELKHEELELTYNKKYDFVVSAVGLEGKNPTYYIAQDGERRISSKTGVFSAVDVYKTFGYNKAVYVYAVTADGVATEQEELMITKVPKPGDKVENFLAGSTFSLVGKKGQSIKISEDFPLVGGGEISLEALKAPFGVEVHGSDVKISFGVDIFKRTSVDDEPAKNEWLFENFKKEFKTLSENVKSAQEELDIYRLFKEKYSDEYSGYYEKNKNFDVEFLGYAEATIVNGEVVFKDILLNVKGQFTFKYTQQGAIWVIPSYCYVEAGASVGLTTQWARMVASKDVPLDFGFVLDIEPELKVGGGAGVKGAVSAGIYGKGSLAYQNNFSEQHHTLTLNGEFGAEAEFFILKGDVSLLKGKYTLVDAYYGSSKIAQKAMNSVQKETEEVPVSLVSRDYTASQWLGGYPAASSFAVAANGVSFRDLQTDVFARSQPQVAELGEDLVMVWVEDAAARDTYNRMRLVYSVYDSASDTWSAAQPVCDDGHNDAYPSLISDGKQVYVAWQKIDKTVTEADCNSVDVFLEESEIYAAAFDSASKTFGKAVKLTDNKEYEYGAEVTIENNAPVVYYVSAAGSELTDAGKNTLYRQPVSGAAKAAVTSLNYILEIDAADGNVSYVMDGDGDTSSTNDVNVYTLKNGKSTAFDKGENQVAYLSAAYGDFKSMPTLFVTDQSNIYYMDGGECKAVLENSRAISGNLNVEKTSAGTAILWTELEEGWNELYAVSFEDGSWTKPVKISQNGKLLSSVDTAVCGGKLVGVCNATNMEESAGQYSKGATDLCSFVVNDFVDIAVSKYISFDETTLVPGSEQSFEVFVSNAGTVTAESVTFTITDTLGTEHTETKKLDLIPGDTQMVTLKYPVPAAYGATTLEVTASVPGYRDGAAENNTASIQIGKPDLSVKENTRYQFADGYVVNLNVVNQSAVEAKDVVLTVSLDEQGSEPVHTQKLGTLDRNHYADVDLALGEEKLTFDDNGVAKVYVTVRSAAEDGADADNTLCLLITKPVEIQEEPGEEPDQGVLGDIDNNGEINGFDLLRLKKYLSGVDVETNLFAADLTADGKVNGFDLLRLKRILSGNV